MDKNTSLFKEELTRIPVWVKIHDVPLQVFSEDGISLIATQIGKPIMLDSFTSSMCIDSWGRSSFARCLIEVKAGELLKDSITVGISLPDGLGFTKETVRVEYEWKSPRCEQCKIFGHAYDQCPKSATAIPIVDMTNDGFQTVRFEPKAHGNSPKNEATNVSTSAKDDPTSSKEEPAKAVDIPSSSYTSATAKKGGLKDPTISSNIPTSNPYDLLSQEFNHENYMRSGGDPNSVYEE
ncbi:zinc knuckle CX2CX4HX4C containing protein [Tanacetum coccineum]